MDSWFECEQSSAEKRVLRDGIHRSLVSEGTERRDPDRTHCRDGVVEHINVIGNAKREGRGGETLSRETFRRTEQEQTCTVDQGRPRDVLRRPMSKSLGLGLSKVVNTVPRCLTIPTRRSRSFRLEGFYLRGLKVPQVRTCTPSSTCTPSTVRSHTMFV